MSATFSPLGPAKAGAKLEMPSPFTFLNQISPLIKLGRNQQFPPVAVEAPGVPFPSPFSVLNADPGMHPSPAPLAAPALAGSSGSLGKSNRRLFGGDDARRTTPSEARQLFDTPGLYPPPAPLEVHDDPLNLMPDGTEHQPAAAAPTTPHREPTLVITQRMSDGRSTKTYHFGDDVADVTKALPASPVPIPVRKRPRQARVIQPPHRTPRSTTPVAGPHLLLDEDYTPVAEGPASGLLTKRARSEANLLSPGGTANISTPAARPVVATEATPESGPLRFTPCNCKKSKCLKLYCECFAAGRVCGESCRCQGCCNRDYTSPQRQKAVENTLHRNPHAFKPKFAETKATEVANHHKHLHAKGCHCKKSGCLKKYCECFQAGIVCGPNCKCCDCKNYDGNPKLEEIREKVAARAKARERRATKSLKDKDATPAPPSGPRKKAPPKRTPAKATPKPVVATPPLSGGLRPKRSTARRTPGASGGSGVPPPTPALLAGSTLTLALPCRRVMLTLPIRNLRVLPCHHHFGPLRPAVPVATIITVFSYVANDDIYNASLVCKTWAGLAMHGALWDWDAVHGRAVAASGQPVYAVQPKAKSAPRVRPNAPPAFRNTRPAREERLVGK